MIIIIIIMTLFKCPLHLLQCHSSTSFSDASPLQVNRNRAYFTPKYLQINYSGRRLDGFGLSDGEVMERLWSYLRPTSKITKEMTPAHRVDTLTDFLIHYAKKSISSLGKICSLYFIFLVLEHVNVTQRSNTGFHL